MKKPLYIQFSDKIRNMIFNEEYQYGQRFPSERELENEYTIDRKTIRKSLNILVEEGLLTRIQGKGTFVKNPSIQMPMKKVMGFSRLLRQEGVETTSKVISATREEAGFRLSKIMNIKKTDIVNKLIRIRMISDEPIAVEITYIRDVIDNFLELDFGVYSLFDTLEQKNHVAMQVEEEVHAVALLGVEAQWLNKKAGDMAFLVTDITKDQNGDVIEYNKAYTNSERIVLSTQLD
ncbi:MAG: GntR family transcriptional regulator [Herbinix sp.]|nr:GntR family transcriptional regulator [Herbinix sp.]